MTRGLLLLGAVGMAGASVAAEGALGWRLLLVGILLLASSFFSGSETALFGLQPVDRQALQHRGPTGRLIARMRDRPRRLLATILLGNEVVNVTISSVSAALVARLLPGRDWANVLIVLPLLVLFGEIIPKNVAIRFGRQWALAVAWPLYAFSLAVAPLRWLFSRAVGLLARPFGVRGGAREELLREEHFRRLVEEGRRQGAIHPVEQQLIEAVFEFGDIPVSRVMTPRPDLVLLPADANYQQVLETVREHGVSRIPVYEGERDNVVGVLLTKDLLRFLGRPPPNPEELRALLHPPYFVPTLKRADDLLEEMRRRRVHLALVVDEHGSLAGLVTLDDLLAELLGDVADESDRPEEEIREEADGSYLLRASIDIDDLEERLGLRLPEGDYTTLGGFILAQLGELPRTGESIEWEGHRFEVVEVTRRRIERVRLVPAGRAEGRSP